MLILQRKKGEALSINDNITLTVMDTGTDWVKLAIDAPKEIPVLRTELKEAVVENQRAAETVPKEILEEMLKQNK
ncbi:MAG: carbon storage regulator [Coprococcus sp.]|nr:carbon storage regulator [Coprococcus sp.]